ncbi:MAG TPA: PHP domain-containing protein, partial [Phycisphaerales bacterium]|nr:PHP domain-containing protein [Phycisphaerales bacterium]
MPEHPDPKAKQHPWAEFYRERMLRSLHAERLPQVEVEADAKPQRRVSPIRYAELQVTSNFTFLTGASHPDELVVQAGLFGHEAIAITDVNSMAGIVRAHVAAKEMNLQFIVGCRLVLREELSVLVYPTDALSYGRLCRLLTIGKRRTEKGQCDLSLHDLIDHHEGLLAVIVPPMVLDQHFIETTEGLRRVFDDDRLSIAASCLFGEDDRERLAQLSAFSQHTNVPLVAVNNVHYHIPERRPLQDVLTCIRHGCTIEQAGYRLFANAERFLKPPEEMARLFTEYPHAIARTVEIAERTKGFSLDQLKYQYPEEVCPPGKSANEHLADLTWAGSVNRYPQGVSESIREKIHAELGLIEELSYAPYFLTVHDLVQFARSKDILCQGRGAAANSAVCYCLGVTSVDPDRINL